LAHGQFPAQGQSQRLKQGRKAPAFARRGHWHLGGFAATTASDAWHLGVKPGFILEEVQVPPLTLLSVVDALVSKTTCGAGQTFGIARELKVDAPAGSVEVDFFNAPRRRQTQRTGEQGFDFNTHFLISGLQLLIGHPPRGFVDNSPASCPQAPPGSTTTLYFSSQVPHGMTKGRHMVHPIRHKIALPFRLKILIR
jgi:hypothetical protein